MPHTSAQASDQHLEALRRRRRLAEEACQLAEHLAPADAALVQHVLRHGQSVAAVARLRDQHPRKTLRRFHHLMQRLRKPAYRLVVDPASPIPPAARRTARLVVCQGMTLRRAAAETGKSLHHVRAHVSLVRTLAGETT